jgi:hypothetical protein
MRVPPVSHWCIAPPPSPRRDICDRSATQPPALGQEAPGAAAAFTIMAAMWKVVESGVAGQVAVRAATTDDGGVRPDSTVRAGRPSPLGSTMDV